MSMMYCHKHDRHYDIDYVIECPECEEDGDRQFDEARDNRLQDELN